MEDCQEWSECGDLFSRVASEEKAKRQHPLPFLVFAPSPCGRGPG